MPYLIPDDWDGVSTQSYKLIWPDSPQWLSILAGGLTGLLFPENWDAGSGDVDDVLSDVREIIDQNSVTGLLPGLEEDVIVQQVRSCPLIPVQDFANFNVLSTEETVLAYGFSLGFPSQDFLVNLSGMMTFRSPTGTLFYLYLRDYVTNQLLARAAVWNEESNNTHQPYVITGYKEGFTVQEDNVLPVLSISANNDNGRIYFSETAVYLTTVTLNFDISGGNFRLVTA